MGIIGLFERFKKCFNFTNALQNQLSTKVAILTNKRPSRSIPVALTRNMSSGNEDQAGDTVGQKISHLAKFNDRPKSGLRRMRESIVLMAVPSSKYQAWRSKYGHVVFSSVTRGWIASANKNGPNGSSCWTPHPLCKVESPAKRKGDPE